jgi:hypothetical protein
MGKMTKPYPTWVCDECGEKYGKHPIDMATYHVGKCDICGKDRLVTEPRNFGHLKWPPKEKK